MDKQYHEGAKHNMDEINDFLCLPSGVDFWTVIGDSCQIPLTDNQKMVNVYQFNDGLKIPDILEKRGQEISHLICENFEV